MKKVILVIGAPHSGSTLLSLVLGSHSSITSLGELARTFNIDALNPAHDPTPVCSCSKPASQCRFWRRAQAELMANPATDLSDFYHRIVGTFGELYGDDQLVMDSSKSIRALRVLADTPDFDVHVLFLVKDVRSYAMSMLDKNGGSVFSHFLDWHRKNRKALSELQARSMPYFTVSYEQLCLDTRKVLTQMCAFIDVEFEPAMADCVGNEHHILSGNRMRKKGGQPIKYDARWLRRREWLLPSLLLPNVMRLNKTLVYRNE